jgi:UrcA family protein
MTGAAAPASADPIVITGVESGRVTAVVDIAGLDRRIVRVAARVCGAAETRSTGEFSRVGACRSDAVAETRRRVAVLPAEASVTLTAIYEAPARPVPAPRVT